MNGAIITIDKITPIISPNKKSIGPYFLVAENLISALP